jgi:alkylation response protein AidB-like acyl-CoA dehydrogenase
MTEGYTLTRDEAALVEKTRAFAADHVAPAAPLWEHERRIGREALAKAAELGLPRLQVATDAGGLGYSFSCKAAVAEVLAAADFGFAMSLVNTQNIAQRLARDLPPEQALGYVPDLITTRRLGCTALTEPGAGSDFAAINTTARKDGDGWVLDGEKLWIINAAEADVIVVYAQTDPGSGAAGIASFLVDATRPGFARTPIDMFAQSSIGAGGFRLSGYRADAQEMISAPGRAFKTALGSINEARVYVAAMCCGMLCAALEAAARYGAHRQTFGQPLLRHQGWRMKLAEAEVDLSAARLMVCNAAAAVDRGEDVMLDAARAKIFATRMAERHLPALAQLMGAEGLRETHPFGRHMIGARMASFTDGSTEMLLERLTAGRLRDLPGS